MPVPTVPFPDGTRVPAIGQGTWRLGERPDRRREEVRALQLGLDLGLRLIDTAELYGEAEGVVGEALRGRRDQAFVVSKVLPSNAGRRALIAACEQSLRQLEIEQLDLYLLHWRSATPLEETLGAFETLVAQGKIARYGVSNFDAADMRQLARLPAGDRCQTDQVLYHLGSRGIEVDLLPQLVAWPMPVMAYCPLAQGEPHGDRLWRSAVLQEVAERYRATPAQVLLAWAIRPQNGRRWVIAIPKAATAGHVRLNAEALALTLDPLDLARLEAAFPRPPQPVPLEIV